MLVRENHPRYEAYLKRILNSDQYHDIRIIEPCIVNSVLDKKVYQFVVVGSEGISLEGCIPMKVIHFADVTSIYMEPDKPNFLKGQEQDDAQHVVVKYKTNKKLNKQIQTELNKRIKNLDKKSKNSKEKDSDEKKFRDTTLELERIPEEKQTSKNNELMKSIDEKSSVINISTAAQNEGNEKQVEEIKQNQKRFPIDRYLLINLPIKSSIHSRALSLSAKHDEPQIVEAMENGLIMSIYSANNKEKSIDIKINKSIHANNIDNRYMLMETQENVSAESNKNEVDNFIKLKFENPKRSCLDEEIIDLYFLNDKSHFFVILKQAWINFKLRVTSSEECLEYKKFITDANYCFVMERKFVDLKRKLLTNLERENLSILEDLKLFKCHLTFDLPFRRLFWKDGMIFTSLVKHLKSLSSKVVESIEVIGNKQFDLEMSNAMASILITMETLCLSLRETEIFRGRMSHVTESKGRDLAFIAEVITMEMDLSGDNDLGKEVVNFYVDFTSSSIDLMYDILLLLSIHPSLSIYNDLVNVEWMIKSITDMVGFKNFLDRIMTVLMSFNGIDDDKLSSRCTLFVYKSFYLIDIFIKYDPSVGSYLKEKYKIDFKYTFNKDFFNEKIPRNLLMSTELFQIIDRVIDIIFTQD